MSRYSIIRVNFEICLIILFFFPLCYAQGLPLPERSRQIWQKLEPGLEFGEFTSPVVSASGDSVVRVLRIDTDYFYLKLLMVSAVKNGQALLVKEWAKQYNLVAAINASMYQKDYRSSISLMKTRTHVNNPRLSNDKSILAFDTLNRSLPEVYIIDRECDEFEKLSKNYGTLIQSIRMISCSGKNVWAQQEKRWSTALIATTTSHQVLFIHVRSAYSTHDLINILRKLPLNISRALYAEGGQEAQLYINSGNVHSEFGGSFDSDLLSDNEIQVVTPLPNIVGVIRKNNAAPE
ncbi:phosphodiester glycosidase family protein [candidate division CSSED10-310 bacterium]|uniref:Phosphodiester glycosidase family protein n=1 Tax=candidate division CSSED10-310 bacterium TaxID=2855610 RepID=A0ABV6YSR1_UNCC1